MGVVYKARERRLNRLVALKMILAGDYAAPSAAERIRAEAEIVARLQHPNIVRIHATGDCDGRPYVELEYLGGGSLADHLNGTPWAPRDAARLVASLARAMAEAHRLGIIHRDLKPANILLSTDGTPKISDFGLAKVIDNQSELTCTESIVGSPRYMAPEQAIGQPRLVGPAADVYALGSTLYELLTGRPPFVAPTVLATLELVKNTEPVPPRRLQPTLASDLQTICLKCLRKDPGDRYPSAEALADDLTRFLNGEPILARPTLPWERGWKWMRRYPAMTALGVVSTLSVMGALLAGALYCVERTRQHEAVETRIERVHNEVHQFIVMGGEAFRRSDWYGAKTQYSTALALARTEPKLTGLRERVMRSLEQTEAKIAERARLVGVHKDLDETFADLAAVIVPSAEVRSLYSAARLMCLAASALDQNPESSADDWEDAVRYRTDALVLVARSIARIPEDQRSRFWAHVVRSDRALETIRSSKEYVELEARIVALVATDRAAPAERP
jgi:tRNA A-37 threonylcarbamoyl transferase component Bud32